MLETMQNIPTKIYDYYIVTAFQNHHSTTASLYEKVRTVRTGTLKHRPLF